MDDQVTTTRAGRTAAAVVAPVVSMLLLALAACGGGASPAPVENRPPATPVAGRTVTLTGSASVVILGAGAAPNGGVKTISAVPPDIRVRPGESQGLVAQAFDERGLPVGDVRFRWDLLNPAAGELAIAAAGRDRAIFRANAAAGFFPAAVRVTLLDSNGESQPAFSQLLDVTIDTPLASPTLVAIEAVGDPVKAASGQLIRLQAVGYDALGRVVPATRFEWEMTDPALGSVNAFGYLTVRSSPGSYPDALVLRGIYGDNVVETRVELDVLERPVPPGQVTTHILPRSIRVSPGDAFKFDLIALDGSGQPVRLKDTRWTVRDPRAGVIDNNGVFHAGDQQGTFENAVEISSAARPDAAPSRATVIVRPRRKAEPLQSITVRPASALLTTGKSTLFSISTTGANLKPGQRTSVSWEVTDPAVGEIDELGTFTAKGPPGRYAGAVTARATQEIDGRTIVREASADIIIVGEITRLEVGPERAVVAAQGVVQFRARAFDENGVEVPGVLFDWSVLDPQAGAMRLGGEFTAGTVPGVYEKAIQVVAVQRLPD